MSEHSSNAGSSGATPPAVPAQSASTASSGLASAAPPPARPAPDRPAAHVPPRVSPGARVNETCCTLCHDFAPRRWLLLEELADAVIEREANLHLDVQTRMQ